MYCFCYSDSRRHSGLRPGGEQKLCRRVGRSIVTGSLTAAKDDKFVFTDNRSSSAIGRCTLQQDLLERVAVFWNHGNDMVRIIGFG